METQTFSPMYMHTTHKETLIYKIWKVRCLLNMEISTILLGPTVIKFTPWSIKYTCMCFFIHLTEIKVSWNLWVNSNIFILFYSIQFHFFKKTLAVIYWIDLVKHCHGYSFDNHSSESHATTLSINICIHFQLNAVLKVTL